MDVKLLKIVNYGKSEQSGLVNNWYTRMIKVPRNKETIKY
jgi:hypothetical protein